MSRDSYKAAIFDLDGVLTRTARLHAQAWKRMFDEFLEQRSDNFEPFDIESDYRTYVDGKPRYDGARSFLAAREIAVPEGDPGDEPGEITVCGLGNRKNEVFQELLREEPPETFPDAVACLEAWREQGMKLGLITSSKNGRAILESVGLHEAFDVVIDGIEAARLNIAGKPAPDVFLEAARRMNVDPKDAIILEDAVSGVEAGRAGDFGLVVGVARGDDGDDLRKHGADVVLTDLRHLDLNTNGHHPRDRAPEHALEHLDSILSRLTGARLVLVIDYDGTLTPPVKRPEDATLSDDVRSLLEALSSFATVAIISWRDLGDLQDLIGLESLYYLGSNGFDLAGPDGFRVRHEKARARLSDLDDAERSLSAEVADIDGACVERKRFSVTVHYGDVAPGAVSMLEKAVDRVAGSQPHLQKVLGKEFVEFRPGVEWDRGRAVQLLLDDLDLVSEDVLPVYVGDGAEDEPAFQHVGEGGLTIRIGPEHEATDARYILADPAALEAFMTTLRDGLSGPIDEEPRRREMHLWELVYRDWAPGEQPLREALCALGNGNIVTRGAFEEVSAGKPHYPGTYLAGGYNRLESEVSGRIIENEDLVNWPNWLTLTFRPEGGEWFHPDTIEILDFEVRLDVRRGLLTRQMRFRDSGGRESHLISRRLVSMASPQYAAIEWTLKPLNWSGGIEIRSALDGSVVNDNVARYRSLSNRHLEVVSRGWEGDDAMYLTVRTNQSLIRMAQAARTRVYEAGLPAPTRRLYEESEDAVEQRLLVECSESKELCVEKVVSIRTSFDRAISEPEAAVRKDIRRAPDFSSLLRDHETKWRHLWSISDIELHNGDVQSQLILRLHLFHLLQTVSTNTIARDVGVPARGWHGEAYRGHIFWDELFIFPLLVLRIPELARSVLMYRYRRLSEARHMARDAGFRGAMYPWQSGSDGREESQVMHLNPESGNWLPDTTYLQRHVNAAIAYNVWSYYQASADCEFLAYYGAEMIIEIARFWASIAHYNAERGRYEIHGVVGPDEFHTDDPHAAQPGLRNNAYTNVLASWVLRCAHTVLDELDEERRTRLREEVALGDEELRKWDDVSRRLLIPFHDNGIISQFEGYETLEEFDWTRYEREHGDIHRLDRILEAEGDDVNRYKASKQADVLMLLFVFPGDELRDLFAHMGYELSDEQMDRNIDYYMQRTSHGSTLSRIVHSWVLARRDREKAWHFWQEALHSDIEDIQGGTAPEGIHLGAMAGTVDLIHRGHAGIVIKDDALWFDPLLPVELADVRMRLRFRRHWLTVVITQQELNVSVDRGGREPLRIGFRGDVVEMGQGDQRTFRISDDGG